MEPPAVDPDCALRLPGHQEPVPGHGQKMDFCFGYGENGVSQQNLTNLVTEPFNMENYEWNFGVQ